jgi:hypothetical protein
LDVGNPDYWTVRAIELIMETTNLAQGSDAYHHALKDATTLLILARAKQYDAKNKKQKKTRKHTTRKDQELPKDS